ncbi:MAG: hypothetical protein P4L53_06975 [Candidatus Obscuribacterales bacterium]|nr:hypothetical protein [Candidatus Obscuribacterales bacterium]
MRSDPRFATAKRTVDALDHLTWDSYNDLYTSFLYLNERMGTFTKNEKENYGFE